jgi:peptidyl-prolyl cis-trans isomerase C
MRRIALTSLALVGLLACTQKTAKVDSVATVDGKPISRNTFNHYVTGVASKPVEALTSEQRTELLDNLIRAEVIADDAEKAGVPARPDTHAVMELSRLSILQQAASEMYLKDRKPTEVELKAEYDEQIAAMPRIQFHARHILVASKEGAENLIKQLDKGAPFDKLAMKESTDSGSKEKGGDLDWFSADRMVPAFSDALKKLSKGEYTHTPVQTQYGWHVIRLDDTREPPPPPYESVKERLVQIVEAKKFKAHVDDLMTRAKVVRTP